MRGVIPPLPNTPSWCSAQLKHRGITFTLTHWIGGLRGPQGWSERAGGKKKFLVPTGNRTSETPHVLFHVEEKDAVHGILGVLRLDFRFKLVFFWACIVAVRMKIKLNAPSFEGSNLQTHIYTVGMCMCTLYIIRHFPDLPFRSVHSFKWFTDSS
jgi:hypothetical protein